MKLKSIAAVLGIAIATTFSTTLSAKANNWVYMGTASTGEEIYVSSDGIYWDDGWRFMYSIGNEVIYGKAYCDSNQWYAEGYNQYYSPQSQATQSMLNYVCSAGQY
jgi:hypothetical protein